MKAARATCWLLGIAALVPGHHATAAGGASDCCVPHAEPACDDKDCTQIVCDIDVACCAVLWDQTCVDLANEHCVACGAKSNCCEIRPEPGCDVPSCAAAVCEQFPACCDVGWGQDPFSISGICVDLAIELCGDLCHHIADDCGHEGAGTCCEDNDTPWCEDDGCCRHICLGDPDDPLARPDSWCCLMEWDAVCAQQATNNEQCDCFGEPMDCCVENFTFAGCLDGVCESCVCKHMPECCMFSWTPFCVEVAQFTCQGECGCEVEIPPCPDTDDSSCCYAGFDEGGCGDLACCDAVCAQNPSCCGDSWHFGCAEDAIALCDVCGSCTSPLLSAQPAAGVVDARRPFAPAGGPLVGLGSVEQPIMITVEQAAGDAGCFTLCESSAGGLEPNAITFVQDYLNGSYEIFLARPITPGAVTTIYYGDAVAARYFYHPGNVDGDNITSPLDLLALIDYINGVAASPWGLYSEDIDNSGQLAPADILALVDLLNGAGALDPWNGTPRPETGDCP